MDEGHYITELILKETEEDVARVYRQAAEETQKKLDDYLRKFQTKDEIKRRQLKAGEITKAEYDYWKTGQIMIGKRWEEMRDTLAADMHNANNLARSIVEGHMPDVYATNHNYATFQIEKGSLLDTSYTLYDRDTVERIIRDQPDLLPPPGPRKKASIAAGKDIAWQRGQIQSVTLQSILQGESIPNMAKRIATTMGETNMNSAVRYARTATTGAENAGRVDAYERAELMGIELEQEWLATLDGRTRHSHRQMDGQHVKVGEKFSNGCKYPGDPDGPGSEIWNCRCTLVPRVKGVDQSNAPRNSKLGDTTYEEWKGEHGRDTYKSNEEPYTKVKINSYDWEMWAVGPEPFQDALLHGEKTANAGWGRVSEEEQERILKVSQQMQVEAASHKYKDHVTVYRGESFDSVDKALEVYKTGTIYTTPKLTSTATKRSIAEEYANMGPGINVLQFIDSPGGVRGIMTDPMGIGGSDEIIMPVGNTFKVTGTSWDPNTNTLKVYMFAVDNKKLNTKNNLELLERVKHGDFRRK